jgi:hypothetical protein
MDVFLWGAIVAVVVAIAASIARYRIIALAAALIAGGAALLDHYGNNHGAPAVPEVSADRDTAPVEPHGSPVSWSRLYIDSTLDPKSAKPANIAALSIAGTNVGGADLKLEAAYFVSGIDGTKLDVRIGRDGMRYKVQDLSPLPPGAFFFVVSDPIGPTNAGLSIDDFLKTWAMISFVVKYNGTTQTIEFSRGTVESLLPKPPQL